MRNLKVSEAFKELGIMVCTSIIPSIISVGAYVLFLYNVEHNNLFDVLLTLGASIIAFVLVLIFYNFLSTNSRFRIYRQYEGRWIQIIPGSDRQISIIDFRYNKKSHQYLLTGSNFDEEKTNSIEFTATKFVKRDNEDGFYYITNYTFQHKNSLGKIGFISNNIDNLTRAEGYFFDASTEQCSRKYNTIMIKCDKNFFSNINPMLSETDFEKIPAKIIAEMSKGLVQKECDIYHEQMKAYKEREKCRANCCNNICKNKESQVQQIESKYSES